MPAEIVHWEILNSICSAENTNPNAKKILLEFPECAALGALGHDAPYFFNAGTSAATSKSCSFLHGAFGDDPLVFLYHALTIAKEKKLKPAEAFVLGMITHYAADSCFHPLVYYLTGNYYSSDIEEQKLVKTRHRRFEVFLDTWWKYNFDSPCHDPKILLKKANKHLAEIGEVLSIALSRSSDKFEISAKNWEKSIRHLVFICKLTTNPFIGILMKFFNFISLGKLDRVEAISKIGRQKNLAFFDQKFNYKLPISGKDQLHSLKELRSLAINRSIETISFLLTAKSLNEIPVKGFSMDMGEIGVKSSEAKFFSKHLKLFK